MFLRYASPIHAQQALSRNGQIIDGRLRLGVVPVDNEVNLLFIFNLEYLYYILDNILIFPGVILFSTYLKYLLFAGIGEFGGWRVS